MQLKLTSLPSVTPSHSVRASAMVAFIAAAGAMAVVGTAHAQSMARVWGANVLGQASPPQIVEGVTAVATGGGHCLALLPNGSIRGWGANTYGGINFNYGQTVAPSDLGACKAIAAGDYISVALRTDSIVRVWGKTDSYGTKTIPADLGACKAIACFSTHIVALQESGTVRAWGRNHKSQCVVPADLGACKVIACGTQNSGAIRTDGTVVVWGSNDNGVCTVPSDVGASTAIAIGDRHGIALLEDRTVRTWGSNAQGQLNVPVGIGACISVAAGYYNSVALQADGVVRVWGNNTEGECNVPPDLVGVTSIAASQYNVAAVQAKSFIELLSDANAANAALTAANTTLTARLNCGDLNGDGEVNGADLGKMLIGWGQCQ